MKKEELLSKRIECIIGFSLLIPPILGVFSFVFCLFGNDSRFANLFDISENWSFGYKDGGGMSATPLYFGLMALAGVYLVKGNIKYFFIKPDKEEKE